MLSSSISTTELLALVEPTRSENGCLNYDLHQDTEDSSLFMFYENWTSKQDLDKHLQSPHLQALRAKAEGLFAEPINVTLWQMIR